MATIKRDEKSDYTPGSPDQAGASGAYSNSAIAMMPPGQAVPASERERVLGVKIARAMLSGPREITKDATVAEMGADGSLIILRQGTHDWVCFPGDENEIGNVPMCADPMGLQWMMTSWPRSPSRRIRPRVLSTCCAVLRSTAIPIPSIEQVQLFRLVLTG
jgi:hypothetical protein